MPYAAALSQHPLATHAVGEVVGEILERLGDAPDAAVLFVTGPFAGAMEDIAGVVRETLRPGALVGATSSALLADGQEVEQAAAVSLLAMRFGPRDRRSAPLAQAVRFDVAREDDGWRLSGTADVARPGATLVLLADPFTFPTDAFVHDIASRSPGLVVVGGLASAASGPGGNRLVADDAVISQGAVGLLLPPGIAVQAVVSQGCRPVGEPLVVTQATENLVVEIAGQPALDRLMEQADAASPDDRRLMARGLHIGLVVDESREAFGRGDFLVRDVLGADHERGAVAIGAEAQVGSTVQFHVRDATSAHEDLRALLADTDLDAGGALVFTCVGRGSAFFDEAHQDALAVADRLPGGASAGMFCAGEIGPVGPLPHLHSMSTVVLLLADPR